MPINATYEYENAEKNFHEAHTISEKFKALQEMLAKAPGHKGAEKLRKSIKERIKKYKELLSKLTNAKPVISEIEFTTKLHEIGILDYRGIKLQILEIPAITKNYNEAK